LLSSLPLANAQSSNSEIYATALANDARPAADVARDASRKPAEVLAFLGIEPGMSVLDMFSGGGYYSELLAYVVGEDGHVVAHSNKAYLQFVGEEFVARYAGGRLPNVDILMAENNKLKLDAKQFDAIFMGLSFHDTYWINPDMGWQAFDRGQLFATLFTALKPGGILGVTDHFAAKGSGATAVPELHRIEKSIVVADLEAAGFELEAESDVLRNPDDDHSKSVFAPEIRGQSDRFVLKFRKPR
jgi:predicted methyltransferase